MKTKETTSGTDKSMQVEGGENTPSVAPPSFNLTSDAPLQGFGMEETAEMEGGSMQNAPIQRQPDPTTPGDDETHTVQRGETPRALATRFGVTVEALKAANQVHTWNINGRSVEGFEAGQEITIPASPSTVADNTTADPVAEPIADPVAVPATVAPVVVADNAPALDEPATADEAAEVTREADDLDRAHMFSSSDHNFAASRWENRDDTTTSYAETFEDRVAEELETEFGRAITHAEVLALIQTETEAGNTEQAEEYRRQLFRANQYAVVETLDVDQTDSGRSTNQANRSYRGDQDHRLYGPTNSDTYCNIYAYDAVTALGGYIPRIWWYERYENLAIAAMEAGTDFDTDVTYGETVREMNANSLNAWFDRIGEHFGWREASDMEEAQNSANEGNIVVLSAANINAARSGHISMIMSEREQHQADRVNDEVTVPLTSQAGSSNHKYDTGSSWWNNASHTNGKAWIHEGQADSPLLTPEQLGLANTETAEQEETVADNAVANTETAGPVVNEAGPTATGGETTNETTTEGATTATAQNDDTIVISHGIMQMISEGSFAGNSDDVRKPHFPENLRLFAPIAQGEVVAAEDRYNVSSTNRYTPSASGIFKIKRNLRRHVAGDYDTPVANGERVATGKNNSGVTIGFGYDIGAAWNVGDKAACKAEFLAAGISESDADSLADCVGLRTTVAGKKAAQLRETMEITAAQAMNLLSVAMGRYEGNIIDGAVHPALEEVFVYISYWQGTRGGSSEVAELYDAADGKSGAEQFQAVLDRMDAKGWNTGAYVKIQRYIRTIKGYLEDGKEVTVVDSTNLEDLLGGENDTFRVVNDATNGTKDYHEQLTGEAQPETPTTTTGGTTTTTPATTTDSPALTPGDAGVRSHTVVSGQTPAQIAAQYGVSVDALLAGNRVHTWNIGGREVQGFQSGQVILIPAGGTVSPAPVTAPRVSPSIPVAPAAPAGGGTPAEQVNAQYKLYSDGSLSMPALARALKPYATSNGSLVVGVMDKLGWSSKDNFSYALSNNSSNSELAGFSRSLLTRMSSELDTYFTMSAGANMGQKARIDAALGTGLARAASAGVARAGSIAASTGGNEPMISTEEFAAGETMTTQDEYQKGNAYIPFEGASGTSYAKGDAISDSDAKSFYGAKPTWCNQFAFDFIRQSTQDDPFGGINQLNYTATAMMDYMNNHSDVFESVAFNDAWDKIGDGDLVIFATAGHISIGYPTADGDMETRNVSGTDYNFGKVIQAGASTGIMGLNYAWGSKKFPSINIYRYTGK